VNATTVDFILYDPYPDILSVLANDWGTGAILPWHFLKDISVGNLKAHASNTAFGDPGAWMPVNGPFEPVEIVPGDYVRLTKNNDYYGYGLGWGPYNIDTLILDWVPDPAVRLLALQTNDVDFGEYPTAPVEEFNDMMNQTKWPYLRVSQYDYPASNPVWFNFDNPYLSNRYVRLAIAHAIPYQQIIGNILPSWGVETAYRGKTYVQPHHYYTDASNVTVHLYNEDLEAYEGNLTKAQMYLNMWKYSQVGSDYTLGPVGDADFNGLVELDDFYIWAGNFGTTSADWTFLPGQDVDPDFDNSDYVEMADFYRWTEGWGAEYPFPGAR
jgi:ABC-type transport system substrate-binding protein